VLYVRDAVALREAAAAAKGQARTTVPTDIQDAFMVYVLASF
jgi:hypothetical protein